MVGRLSCPVAWGILVPSQGSNPHPQHWKADSSPLDHQGSPSENFCSPLAFNQWEGSILSASRPFPCCLLSPGKAAGGSLTSASSVPSQAISISKAINAQEAPVKEKHARRILPAAVPLGPWGRRGV